MGEKSTWEMILTGVKMPGTQAKTTVTMAKTFTAVEALGTVMVVTVTGVTTIFVNLTLISPVTVIILQIIDKVAAIN